MVDYTLYYWPIAFRGQFIRAVLAHVGASWDEPGMDAIIDLKDAAPADQPVPHMGPPVLIDHAADVSLSQTPAILAYLGGKHGLLPGTPVGAALTHKIVCDADDVLYDMTLHNGAQMWTAESWAAYQPRLSRWMTIFEEMGCRHGMTEGSGYMLGTDTPGIADFTAHVLWGVMTDKFPTLRPMLDAAAPSIAGLCDRLGALPEQAKLRARTDAEFGDEWCSGQIEASLRAAIAETTTA